MSNTLFKLLKDKKVADSYQFYTSCAYKLYFAETSFQALKNIINEYQIEETERVQKVYSDAVRTGVGRFLAHKNTVDYLGIEMDVTSAMDKLTMEMMGLLHNFFDTYAQWLNSALLGEKALPIKKATLVNIAQKLQDYPEYAGTFISMLSGLPSDSQYLYIADFNNTLKHRYQIYVSNRFDIFSVTGNVSIPAFSKDGRIHVKEEAVDVLEKCLNFCKQLLSDSLDYVKQYYLSNDCNYVTHRIYNPKTYLLFDSEDDYRAMRSPKNHYYFIEIDPTNIQDEYHIMLCCDRMDKEEKSIECFNSDYQIIMLKEQGTDKIVGIMKPVDSDVFKLNDEHELQYRKYATEVNGYEAEMFMAICGDDKFIYHPYLSDLSVVILGEK